MSTSVQHIGRSFGQHYKHPGISGRRGRRFGFRCHTGPEKPAAGIGSIRIRKKVPGTTTVVASMAREKHGFMSKVAGMFSKRQAGR